MTRLYFVTYIKAARERVFDLSRDVDFHTKSATTSRERAIGGRMSGLLEPGETVRFQGYHFGMCLRHTSTLTEFVHPAYFVDEMTEGHFRYFRHEHRFTDEGERTRMEDILHYDVPFGWCGRLFDRLFLRRHLTAFLNERNEYLKKVAEQEVSYPPDNRD